MAGPLSAVSQMPDLKPAQPMSEETREMIEKGQIGELRPALLCAAQLSSRLSPSDSDALLQWTTGPRPEKLPEDSWAALVNDVWNALRRQKEPSPKLIFALAAFFARPQNPAVLRDYSLQHLAGCLDGTFLGLDAEGAKTAVSALTNAAAMHDQSFAGTALYGLQEAIQKGTGAGAVKEDLAKVALAILADNGANDLARISALQIVMECADTRALQDARRIAADAARTPMLRASAIAYVGSMGAPQDLVLLQGIQSASSDRRLDGALGPAIAKLTTGSASHP